MLKNNFKIILVGIGKFSEAIHKMAKCHRIPCGIFVVDHEKMPDEFVKEFDVITDYSNTVMVHVGSGSELVQAALFASKHKMPFLQLSTGIDEAFILNPENKLDMPIFLIPNSSLKAMKFYLNVEKIVNENRRKINQVVITESHQHSKNDASGTTLLFQSIFKESIDACVEIESIRDEKRRILELGVPRQFLCCHSYHFVKIKYIDKSSVYKVGIKIHDRKEYVDGLLKIINFIVKYKDIMPGVNRYRQVCSVLFNI